MRYSGRLFIVDLHIQCRESTLLTRCHENVIAVHEAEAIIAGIVPEFIS